MPQDITGTIESTVYRNEENGYSVLEIREGRASRTVVGVLPAMAAGERATFHGEWTEHPQHGKQFRAAGCDIEPPSGIRGIERFLGSGLIRGIREDTARRLVETFGEETLDVLSMGPDKLTRVRGIGKKRAAMIYESFREQYSLRRAMIWLQSYGISLTLSLKIAKRYGDRAEEKLRENPYRLVDDVDGVGFATADRIALTLGLDEKSVFRSRAAIKYALLEAASLSGHTYLPRDQLIRQTADMLRCTPESLEEPLKSVVLDREIVMSRVGGDTACMLESYYYAEKETAERLMRLKAAARPVKTAAAEAEKQLDRAEENAGIRLSPRQREAVLAAMREGMLVITGGPGTGKTTIINCILGLMGRDVLLAAPTGRAAKRMSEATGREARTIHRLLEYSGEAGAFQRNEENPLDASCVIVDEMSMVDIFLMRSLLRALKPGTRLVMVGDADQLPSVGPGNVLGDILASDTIPSVRLTEVYRQEGQSMIVLNAHAINHGGMPVLNRKGSDFFFERRPLPEECADAITALCVRRLPGYLNSGRPLQDIQVLSPQKKGPTGVIALNHILQDALNPPGGAKRELAVGDIVFRTGDKVIHTHNDYTLAWSNDQTGDDGEGVFNGDMGIVERVMPEEKCLSVLFDDGRRAEYDRQALENLDLAYCLSVHKSQGSEFPCVVIPVMPGPAMLLTRNLFYTALTRARKLVVLVGREDIISQMVNNDHVARRYTALEERLREARGKS